MRFPYVAASLLLFGCSGSPTVAEAEADGRVPGALEHYGDPVLVELPARVLSGSEFVVNVKTYGGGCTTKGDAVVESAAQSAWIKPFDYDWSAVAGGPVICSGDLVLFNHQVTLRFDRPGTAHVFVQGQRKPSGEIFTVRRSVQVD